MNSIVHGDRGESTDTLDKIRADFRMAIGKAKSMRDIADIKTHFLGKKGRLTAMLRWLGSLHPSQRTLSVKGINAIKEEIEEGINAA